MPIKECLPCKGTGKVWEAPDFWNLNQEQRDRVTTEVQRMKDDGELKGNWGSTHRLRVLACRNLGY